MAGNQPVVPKINSPLGVIRTSQAVAYDVTINVLIYILIYSIIYIFRLRNLLARLNQYFLSATLVMLEFLWLIPYFLVRLIYIIYNTQNESKKNDYRYNTHGVLRTFVVHNQFWKFKNNLVLNSVFQRGANIFLEIQDDIIIPDISGGNNEILIRASEDDLSLITNESETNNDKLLHNFKKWSKYNKIGSSSSLNIFKSNSKNHPSDKCENRDVASA